MPFMDGAAEQQQLFGQRRLAAGWEMQRKPAKPQALPAHLPSLFHHISALNPAQWESIAAKMPKCRRKIRQGDIRH